MEGNYEIFLGENAVGSATVYKAGLYTHFSCRCRIPNGEKLHLKVSCGGTVLDLGLCVPMDGGFGVETKIATKKLAEGTPLLYLGDQKPIPTRDQNADEIVPETQLPEEENITEIEVRFDENEPFEHLEKLDNARLIQEDENTRILIQAPVQDQQDNDQNPLPD